MTDGDAYTPKIAVIGTEGSGKTVFTVVLAHRFGLKTSTPIRLDPTSRKTQKFVRESFDLLNGTHGPPQWLGSTDPGTLFELEWNLYVGDARQFTLRLIDAAGQDFRLLFGEAAALQADTLNVVHRRLVEYAEDADILIVTVNLADFVGEPDADRRESSEWTLKFALDYLMNHGRQPKRVLLLFTQKDRYSRYNLLLGDWVKVAETYLPIREGGFSVGAVAAVAETILDPSGESGPIPKPGFVSSGLTETLTWIFEQAQDVAEGHAQGLAEERRSELERISEETRRRARGGLASAAFSGFLAFFPALLVWYLIFSNMSSVSVWETQDVFAVQTVLVPDPRPYIFRPYPPIPTEVNQKVGETQVFRKMTGTGELLLYLCSFASSLGVAVPVYRIFSTKPPQSLSDWLHHPLS